MTWPSPDRLAAARPIPKRHVGVFRLQLFKPSETFITAQAALLQRYRPTYIGRAEFGPPADGARIVTAGRGALAQARLVGLRDTSALRRGLAEQPPSVLHCHFAVDAVYALPLARSLSVPLIVTIHGFDVNLSDAALLRSRKAALINYRLFRSRLQQSNALFLCVSEFIRQQALARGFPAERTHLHYLGIDPVKLAPGRRPATPGLIVQVARLVEKKGVRYALDALAALKAGGTTAELVVIGDGPLRVELEAHAHALGLAQRVRFLGVQPHAETIAWMRRAEVVLVPSVTAASGDAEGLPTVILEAAALGTPVVASDSGGSAEAVRHGETGFIVEERDVAALAASLAGILSDAGRRDRMGAAARQHVLERFDARIQTARLEDIFDMQIATYDG